MASQTTLSPTLQLNEDDAEALRDFFESKAFANLGIKGGLANYGSLLNSAFLRKICPAAVTAIEVLYHFNPAHVSIGEEIATGAQGMVCSAIHRGVDCVAKFPLNGDEAPIVALKKEAAFLREIGGNPNIVNYIGDGLFLRNDEMVFGLVLEQAAYGSMDTFIKTHRDSPLLIGVTMADMLQHMIEIFCGLAFLHGNKILWLDPAVRNILLDHNFVAKLSDLGLSKLLDSGPEKRPTYFTSTFAMVPVTNASPEVRRGATEIGISVTQEADVYSTAMTFLEAAALMSGKVLFPGMTPQQINEFVEAGKIHPIPADIAPEATEILRKCLELDPGDRPTSSDVALWLSQVPVPPGGSSYTIDKGGFSTEIKTDTGESHFFRVGFEVPAIYSKGFGGIKAIEHDLQFGLVHAVMENNNISSKLKALIEASPTGSDGTIVLNLDAEFMANYYSCDGAETAQRRGSEETASFLTYVKSTGGVANDAWTIIKGQGLTARSLKFKSGAGKEVTLCIGNKCLAKLTRLLTPKKIIGNNDAMKADYLARAETYFEHCVWYAQYQQGSVPACAAEPINRALYRPIYIPPDEGDEGDATA